MGAATRVRPDVIILPSHHPLPRSERPSIDQSGARVVEALRREPAAAVALVTHKGFLRELRAGLLAAGAAVELDFDLEGPQLAATFGNAEVRVAEFVWALDEDGGGGGGGGGGDGTGSLISVVSRTLEGATAAPPFHIREVGVVMRCRIRHPSLKHEE